MSDNTYNVRRLKDAKGIIDGIFTVIILIVIFSFFPKLSREIIQPPYDRLLLLSAIVIGIFALKELLVMPYFYLWAFSKPIDARVVFHELKGSLPFYPKRKWYVSLIPFFGRFNSDIEAIAYQINSNSPIEKSNTDYTVSSVSTTKMWSVLVFYVLITFFLAFFAILIVPTEFQEGGWPLIGLLIMVGLVLHLVKMFRFIRVPNKLTFDEEGLKAGNKIIAWKDVTTIHFDWGNKKQERLRIGLANGETVSLTVDYYQLPWQHIYNYMLYFHQQHKTKATS